MIPTRTIKSNSFGRAHPSSLFKTRLLEVADAGEACTHGKTRVALGQKYLPLGSYQLGQKYQPLVVLSNCDKEDTTAQES